MKKCTLLAVVLAIIFGFTYGVSAEIFRCAFLQDKYRSGKPNKAACAMSPEKVFAKWSLFMAMPSSPTCGRFAVNVEVLERPYTGEDKLVQKQIQPCATCEHIESKIVGKQK